ncbi:hypothetical protein FK531_01940 [Rhodococcus spelaei]|uniref:Uncharacterized protein n=1 Tax=Rhodococcus spelaei TaxID=2546320 RepID=A0A541BRA8_9NOCA|nr:hypothetical protein [Rhodococcus spelaei]TQF74860.1 hypothetical protein FK531_01940 [Rhodococcus spelaei]
MADNQEIWAAEARRALIDVAGSYRSTTTYPELAETIQSASGVRTSNLLQNWIGKTLAKVALECSRRGEPLLSALCVSSVDGRVGDGYAKAVESTYGELPADVEWHAAEERLRCYRHFGAPDLPADGGIATLTQSVVAMRAKAQKRDRSRRREHGQACTECYQVRSLAGVCGCSW